MSDGLMVTIGGLDFYGQGLHDFVISPDGFQGWDDGVDMRLENTARPQAHGSFDLPGFQDARTVSISGSVFADSPKRLADLRSRLTGLLAGGDSGRVQVERFGDTQWATCRLASKTMFTERGGQNVADFQVQLWCPDPRKFGQERSEELTNGASRSLYHYGNAAASPVVVIRGPVSGGYTLSSNDGRVYRVNSGITYTNSTHTIDMNDGLLRVNGKVSSGLVGRADIWDIPPGKILNMALVADSGTASGEVLITDTYI